MKMREIWRMIEKTYSELAEKKRCYRIDFFYVSSVQMEWKKLWKLRLSLKKLKLIFEIHHSIVPPLCTLETHKSYQIEEYYP